MTALILVVLIALFFLFAYYEVDSLAMLCVVAFMLFGMYSCGQSEWSKNRDKERLEEERQKRIPRPLSTTDGCTVYAFTNEGRTHYFTRCGSKVETETTWTENCGKNCTKQMSGNITTTGNER